MKRVRDPSMPVYVADWFGSQAIALMTLEEEGGYFRLLMHAWASGDCSLPDDDDSLSVLSRLGEKWAAGSGKKIRSCFTKRRGKLVNKKLREIWDGRRSHAEKCRQAGIKSGEVRRYCTNERSTNVGTNTPTKRNISYSYSSSSSFSKSIIDVSLKRVRPETLREIGLLLAWIESAVAEGAIDSSEATRCDVLAMAFRCLKHGKKPAALFVSMMREGKFGHIAGEDDDAARAAVKVHEAASRRVVDPDIKNLVSGFLRRVEDE